LLDAQKAGGLVADYATKLLKDITEMKAQAKANTTKPRGWGYALPRRAGDEANFRRRVDGRFVI
jgi:hypothetical protein